MPTKNSINQAKRERALKLLEESDPELARALREEFKKRKNEVEDNKDFKIRIDSLITRYKPKLQCARLSDPVLLYFWALLEQRITGCIADTVGKYFDPLAIFVPGKLKSAVSRMHKWPLLVLINEFHGAGVDEKQIFQLVRLVLERTALLIEYEKRMASRIFGHELRQPEIGRLRKLLKVDKIKSYRPEEGAEDLRQNALTQAYEAYEKQCNTLAVTPTKTIPQFPVKDGASWDFIHAARWETEVKPSLKRVLPILYGTSEEIPEKARRAQRNEWETLKRQRAILADPAAQEETRRHLFEGSYEKPSIVSDLRLVLRRAEKRWGPQAATALQYRAEGKTEKEAAELAGITARSLRNYILKLTKEFSRKK